MDLQASQLQQSSMYFCYLVVLYGASVLMNFSVFGDL